MRFSMEKQAFFALFSHFLTLHGLEKYDTDNIKETFFNLTRLMLETNAVMNVTAIRDVEKIIPLLNSNLYSIIAFRYFTQKNILRNTLIYILWSEPESNHSFIII